MNLEGDLGIDSIKRVEILAAVQEQAPGLPEVDPGKMAALTTLGQIVTYMQDLMGGQPATTPPASIAADIASTPPENMGRYALVVEPKAAIGLAQPGLLGEGTVYITRADTGLADALATTLTQRGVNAAAVDTVPADAKAVVFLGGMRDVADVDAAIAVQREVFGLARSLAPELSENGGLFVTVSDTGGAFGTTAFAAHRAYLAGTTALVKTAAQEWTRASLKAIDLETGDRPLDTLATAIADELLLGGGDIEVGLKADGTRLSARSVKVDVAPTADKLTKTDVVVVSGGGRGVTAACVIALAADTQAQFLLLGRSALLDDPADLHTATTDAALKRALLDKAKAAGQKVSPAALGAQVKALLASREVRSTLAAIEATGAKARYRSASVTDPAAIEKVFAEVRNDWGPITALIHGAGVIADRKIAEQTDEQFDLVFNTKIEGLRVLLGALTADPLKVIANFSSVSARCGNNGQSTYAMANEILNKVAWAESRARDGVLVKSLGWGPWEGGMVNPQLRAHFKKLGVPMIPLNVGAKMLVDELSGAQAAQVEVVLGGEPRPEALLVVGSESRTLMMEVQLSQETHSYLSGHAINGQVVVPVVLAAEWFSRMAHAFRPDLHLQAIKNLKVLTGIKLQDFTGGGDRLVLSCTQLSNGHGVLLALELKSPTGTIHYRAQAQMVTEANPVSQNAAPKLALNDWGGAPIYGDVLFHEDQFQVIESLSGIGEKGISGTLNGVENAEWRWENWSTDVAAMDGGLQLILLWARSAMGGPVLPMSIGELRMNTTMPPKGKIKCVASCRGTSKTRGVADLVFHSESGELFAEIKAVEVILRPDTPKA
jgi:NAD(P)-dependent dehydrogenase (short-subunit alcohol dehydrogenase family)